MWEQYESPEPPEKAESFSQRREFGGPGARAAGAHSGVAIAAGFAVALAAVALAVGLARSNERDASPDDQAPLCVGQGTEIDPDCLDPVGEQDGY